MYAYTYTHLLVLFPIGLAGNYDYNCDYPPPNNISITMRTIKSSSLLVIN